MLVDDPVQIQVKECRRKPPSGSISRRLRLWRSDGFLRLCTWFAPLGFVAVISGWVVTEVGRQPWVIYGVMRTADAATNVRGVWASLAMFTTVYLGLLVLLVAFVRRLRRSEAA